MIEGSFNCQRIDTIKNIHCRQF